MQSFLLQLNFCIAYACDDLCMCYTEKGSDVMIYACTRLLSATSQAHETVFIFFEGLIPLNKNFKGKWIYGSLF